jgi:hypothetical protein
MVRHVTVAPLYIEARRVLLDALVALEPHGEAVIVAGAQAVYLRTGGADLAVAPYTTDGDLALDPTLLGDRPELEAAMVKAGFHLGSGEEYEPGIWLAPAEVDGRAELIPIDLIVPEGATDGRGRRAARLGVHGKRAARRAVGLEAALADHSPMEVVALDPADTRAVRAKVAGPAALLVAKLHKIRDRVTSNREDRLDDKDAADVLRLMLAIAAGDVGATLARLRTDPVAVAVTAVHLLSELFGRRGRPGVEMAARALRAELPADRVAVICVAYVDELLASVR